MKTTCPKPSLYISIAFSIALAFCACSKSNSSASPGADNFIWLHNSVNHTTNLDTAFLSGYGLSIPPYTLIAGYPRPPFSFQVRVQFTLTSFDVGNYTINSSPTSPNRLTYTDDAGNDLNGTSGTLSITANNGNYLTGNFSTTVINASSVTSQLTGNFTNMPIKP